MKKLIYILLLGLTLTACRAGVPEETVEVIATETVPETIEITEPETTAPDPVELLLDSMTTEEKVGQLFIARCPGETAPDLAREYSLGGFVLFGIDFENETPESIREKLAAWQASAEIPLLLAVDEEGGTVNRVSSYPAFRYEPFPSPRELYDRSGAELVGSIESEKGYLLHYLGLNVNLGPVCDITTQPGAFMYRRSLGQSPEITAEFAVDTAARLKEYGVGSVLKHFPGYGANGDTHTGKAVDTRSLEELEKADLIPFAAGIRAGSGAIMVSHNTVTALDAETPASLSPAVHGYLRYTMGFDGVIMTDELSMGAVDGYCTSEEAAVLAVLAGNDLLCVTDLQAQYAAVLAAVQDGRIPAEMLNNAARRVLTWKRELGML